MEPKNKTTLGIIVGLIVLAGLGYWVYSSQKSDDNGAFVTNFEDCAAAGYAIAESYPRQCTSPDGNTYIEEVAPGDEGVSTATAGEGCYIGGCSSQICSDEPGAVSTCEYKPEYSCYKSARCEKQQNGQCGWTETVALTQCLEVKLGDFTK